MSITNSLLASNTGQSNESGLKFDSLTNKEKLTLLAILTTRNDEEAIRQSSVGKTQFYAHKRRLEPFRQQLISGLLGKAVELLQASSIKAAGVLTEMLDSPNPKIRQGAAESVLDRSLGRPRTTELQQTKKQMLPLVIMGVSQASIDKLFTPREQVNTDTITNAEEGEVLAVEVA